MIEISDIKASLDEALTEASCIATCRDAACRALSISAHDIRSITLHRKSIDARKKRDVHFILSARLSLACGIDEGKIVDAAENAEHCRIRCVDASETSFFKTLSQAPERPARPVVVGAGCAGLFAALTLAQAGLKPLLIERGGNAADRTRAIEQFIATRTLDPESNIQFGLGGAGTFSDGKLTTGTKNAAHRTILATLVEAGAPREILWDAKPHVGSDILPHVVSHIAHQIEMLGGTVRFGCRMTDIVIDNENRLAGVTIDEGGRTSTLSCTHVILACGHSARDVFKLLHQRGFELARKTFAMGVRIEHLQASIDRAQYGPAAGHPALGAASYKLVAHTPNGRSLFSFCMCPGGEVVAAASEPGGVVVNGASLHARAGSNANSALLVNVTPTDLPGTHPLEGVLLQRRIEQAAFQAGGGDYRAPAQLVGDFLENRSSRQGKSVMPTYPLGVTWTDLSPLLPPHIVETLRQGIPMLGKKIKGFDDPQAVLTGVETRSSSPVTVVRGATCESTRYAHVFPCGEGAGYAGGIMSAATDGIRCANALIDTISQPNS